MMTAGVRSATPADEAELFALAHSFPTPTPPDLKAFRRALKAKLTDPASALFVAELDGRLVGYVSGYSHVTFYAGVTAWVDEILVVPEHRGGGLGKLLMGAFEVWAERSNCSVVALATRGAAPFYERLGYSSSAAYFKKYLTSARVPTREKLG